MLKKIFNADDFGISPGVNQAIFKAHTEGVLNSTSIMINLKYAPQAIELSQQMPNLQIGLHANLTNEYSVLPSPQIPLLVDDKGKFRHGFVNLALLSVLHPKELKRQVKIEVRAQIEKALASGLKLTHLDSHRHVHMIPMIFKAFLELKEEYKIPRLRFVNENPVLTIRSTQGIEWLKDGGLIKNLVLVSCAIAYEAVEVGIHPGLPEIDKEYLADVFDDNILKAWRQKEFETLLDKTVEQEFS